MKFESNLKIYNLLWFQMVWWGMVFFPEPTVYLAGVLIFVHFSFLKENLLLELAYSLLVATLGIGIDTTLAYYGVFNLHPGQVYQLLPPLWVALLWLSFACTLRMSLYHRKWNPVLLHQYRNWLRPMPLEGWLSITYW